MSNEPEYVPVREAAARLGVSVDTVKRRIRRGELEQRRESRPQGSRLLVALPPELAAVSPATRAGAAAAPIAGDTAPPEDAARQLGALYASVQAQAADNAATLRLVRETLTAQREEHAATVQALREELEARRREVSELHVLLQRSQEQLGGPHTVPATARLAAPAAEPGQESPPATPAPPAAATWRRLLRRWLG